MAKESLQDVPSADTVFLRAPRIFLGALYRRFSAYPQQRPHMADCHHWVAASQQNPEDKLVIHGVIDRQQNSLRNSVAQLHVGVIATQEMGAVWLKINNPKEYLRYGIEAADRIPGKQLNDPIIAYLSEQFSGATAADGDIVTDEATLNRIAEYSEFLTVIEGYSDNYFYLPSPEERPELLS